MSKQDIIAPIGRGSIMITHRVELVDQSGMYPAAVLAAPYVWQPAPDPRPRLSHCPGNINSEYGRREPVAIEYRTIARAAVPYIQQLGRGFRRKPGWAQGMNGHYQYQVFHRGRKWVTITYNRGMKVSRYESKRRSLAIAKGKTWLNSFEG